MTLDQLSFGFEQVQLVVTIAIGIYVWISNGQSANTAEVNALTLRVTTLEEQMRHLPDQELVNALAGDMKAVKSELTAIKDSIVPLARSMDRINDYLLNRK